VRYALCGAAIVAFAVFVYSLTTDGAAPRTSPPVEAVSGEPTPEMR
jgi:hypothetical protein